MPSPSVCPLPARGSGWAVQLYALRSAGSWGIGDFGDLARFGRWARSKGASFVLLNPLHSPLPGTPQEPSPYFASSRAFLNPLYARIDGRRSPAVASTMAARQIDHDLIYTEKMAALEAQWRRDPAEAEVGAFARQVGPALADFAAFCAISEVYGRPWRSWPAELRRPDSGSVADFVAANPERVRFHEWVQWVLDRQLAAAAAEIPLVLDIAIGTDPAGMDAWRWQRVLADGFSVGAPPDAFNADGQDWGITPFEPAGLTSVDYEPIAEVLRAGLRHAAGLRVDHVMGLSRQWWVPTGAGPKDGHYVDYPLDDLLEVLTGEASAAGAFIVGEDLGTVEEGLRDALASRQILSTRVAWFEESAPVAWPVLAMATATTHDLPTVAGVAAGIDGDEAMEERLVRLAGAEGSATERALRIHEQLAASPCLLVAATLEDALGVEERPNYPGVSERPNWSLALPVGLDEMLDRGLLAPMADVIRRTEEPS